jgi:GNAT superfamily N-acetyltransferase
MVMTGAPFLVRSAEAEHAAAFDEVIRRGFNATLSEIAPGASPLEARWASANPNGWGARVAQAPRGERRFWLIEQGGAIIAVSATAPTHDRDDDAARTSELLLLYVVPEWWGRGAGLALLGHAMDDVRRRGWRELSLWVFDANARARRFYERAGLTPDGATAEVERVGRRLLTRRYRRDLGGPGAAVTTS